MGVKHLFFLLTVYLTIEPDGVKVKKLRKLSPCEGAGDYVGFVGNYIFILHHIWSG
jgi:hypothetical protein